MTPSRWRALAWALAGIGFGLAYRYLVVQQHWIGHICDPGTGPWWCHVRQAVILFFQASGFGILALIGGVIALFLGYPAMIALALFAGSAGLVLYNAETAGMGFVLGLIAALRQERKNAEPVKRDEPNPVAPVPEEVVETTPDNSAIPPANSPT